MTRSIPFLPNEVHSCPFNKEANLTEAIAYKLAYFSHQTTFKYIHCIIKSKPY